MIGFIVAILSVAYRYVVRLAFFMYSRADALFMLERRGALQNGVPKDDREFARLTKLLFPDGGATKGDTDSVLKPFIDALRKP